MENIKETVSIKIINANLFNAASLSKNHVVFNYKYLALYPEKCIWHTDSKQCLIICSKLD